MKANQDMANSKNVPCVVITGGEGALAKAIVTEFRDSDWHVFAPSHRELDVENVDAVKSFFHERQVDLLICAAGMIRDAPLVRLSEEAWEKTIAVNYSGAARCASAALPSMLAKRAGHIIFISSYSALHPPVGQTAYASAKAALIGLNGELARAYGPSGIRINAILPGFLETPMTSGIPQQRVEGIKAAHMLGEFNTVSHVAAFIRHLHMHLPYTSGQVFQLDSRPS